MPSRLQVIFCGVNSYNNFILGRSLFHISTVVSEEFRDFIPRGTCISMVESPDISLDFHEPSTYMLDCKVTG